MKSIRRQLTVSLLLALVVLLSGGFAAVLLLTRHELYAQLDNRLRSSARMIASELADDDGDAAVPLIERLQEHLDEIERENSLPLFFEIHTANGVLLMRGKAQAIEIWELDRPDAYSLTVEGGIPLRVVTVPVDIDGLLLSVADSQEELDETMDAALVATAVCAILVFLLTLVLVPWLLRRGLKPLDVLGTRLEGMDAASLNTVAFPHEMPDELRPVAVRLNDLLDRLSVSFERERRVSANLAHEIRTPIAELRLMAESAIKWPDSRDASHDQDTLAVARHMESMVVRMLALARGEFGQLSAGFEEFDLDILVRAAWPSFAEEASQRSIAVRFEGVAGRIQSDPVLLRSICANLLDNAVSYSPDNAQVIVATGVNSERQAWVSVSNPAPDLTSDDINQLFERYWRKESSRTAGGGHLGLGLTIVQTSAEALGWSVSVALGSDQRITFTLLAPASEENSRTAQSAKI